MPPRLRLQASQVADLAEIRDTPAETLAAIRERICAANPQPMHPNELQRVIVHVLGKDKTEEGRRVMRPLLALQALLRQHRIEPDEILEAVRIALHAAKSPWNATEFDRWSTVEPEFKQLLTTPAVRLISIALDLMYEHENLLQGARVVTDIRPVFSDDAEQIEGSVVSHTLRLRYDGRGGDQSLSIALDEADIRELERQCKRALLKARTARTLMMSKANVPTVITGDDGEAQA